MHSEANFTSTSSYYLNKLDRPHIPNATYQVPRSSAFWFWRRRFLKVFYHIWAWRPSWSCDQNVMYKFWLTYHKESSHETWVWLGQWFVWKLWFNILMEPQYERPLAERAKVNLDLWNLFIAFVSLILTYQVRIMTLVSTVFQKTTLKMH